MVTASNKHDSLARVLLEGFVALPVFAAFIVLCIFVVVADAILDAFELACELWEL